MKTDLATSIGAAIVGVLIAYFVCNFFVGQIESVTFPAVDSNVSADLIDPSPEVFNYEALNPTVEVYVGNCTQVNEYGECTSDEQTPDMENGQETS